MRAELSNYPQAPRKVRLVANLVKGKRVADALTALAFLPKRAAEPIAKLIRSAAANAKQAGKDPAALSVRSLTVDAGTVIKRYRPRAFGRASAIRRRRSLVRVLLGE